MKKSSRLFFALWPDPDTRRKLAQLSRSTGMKALKPTPPHNYHVTLVFIGNVDDASEQSIKQQIAGISSEPFTITFDHLNYWPKPKVLCLTSRQPTPQLITLAQALTEAVASCGIQTDPKPYVPHVTLARQSSPWVDRACEPLLWYADSFFLVESCSGDNGVMYQVKEQWPFGRSAGR